MIITSDFAPGFKGDQCFYCHQQIPAGGDYFLWTGASGNIAMHCDCAAELMEHIKSDLQKYREQQHG